MDPSNETGLCVQSRDEPRLHVLKDSIPNDRSSPIPMYDGTFFDTIIVDFSTLKFMSVERLAEFAQRHLERKGGYGPLDGIYVRDLEDKGYEYTVSNVNGYVDRDTTRPIVNIRLNNDLSLRVYLQDGWTTDHYLTFLGLSGRNMDAGFLGDVIPRDKVWKTYLEKERGEPTITLLQTPSVDNMHGLIEIFLKYDLVCVPVDEYPLKNDRGRDKKVRCRLLPTQKDPTA